MDNNKTRSSCSRICRMIICIMMILMMCASVAAPAAYAEGGDNPSGHEIYFDRILNARDLGGYTTADGRVVKKRMLIRSAELSYASAADLTKLRRTYNIGTVIDLRYSTDYRYCKDKRISGAKYINISTRCKKHPKKASARKRYRKFSKFSKRRLRSKGLGDFGKVSRSYTYSLVMSSYSRKKYRKYFEQLLNNKEGKGVLFHCICGKDRTGVAAFMTLVALGVDEETAYRDYAETNAYIRRNAPGTYRKGRVGVTEKDLRYAVSRAKRQYGSLDRFLEKAYGLDRSKRARLRAIYTERK